MNYIVTAHRSIGKRLQTITAMMKNCSDTNGKGLPVMIENLFEQFRPTGSVLTHFIVDSFVVLPSQRNDEGFANPYKVLFSANIAEDNTDRTPSRVSTSANVTDVNSSQQVYTDMNTAFRKAQPGDSYEYDITEAEVFVDSIIVQFN